MAPVKFGVRVPFSGPASTSARLVEATCLAEELGYDSVFAQDHIHKSFERGRFSPVASGSVLDPSNTTDPMMHEAVTSIAFLSGLTKTIELALGVTPLPLRDPVILAKQLATVDTHSQGRLIFGVGVANTTDREEFNALRVPFLPYAERYEHAGECIAAMRTIWENPTASYEGKYISFENLTIYPKPHRRIPVWLGAGSLAGGIEVPRVKFAVEHADGLMPPYLLTAPEFRDMIADFTRTADTVGRDLTDFAWCAQRRISIGDTIEQAQENMAWVAEEQQDMWQHAGYMAVHGKAGSQVNLSAMTAGTATDITAMVREWIDAGANYFDVTFPFRTFDVYLRQLRMFAERVMPEFR